MYALHLNICACLNFIQFLYILILSIAHRHRNAIDRYIVPLPTAGKQTFSSQDLIHFNAKIKLLKTYVLVLCSWYRGWLIWLSISSAIVYTSELNMYTNAALLRAGRCVVLLVFVNAGSNPITCSFWAKHFTLS